MSRWKLHFKCPFKRHLVWNMCLTWNQFFTFYFHVNGLLCLLVVLSCFSIAYHGVYLKTNNMFLFHIQGETPLALAQQKRSFWIVQKLQSHLATQGLDRSKGILKRWTSNPVSTSFINQYYVLLGQINQKQTRIHPILWVFNKISGIRY